MHSNGKPSPYEYWPKVYISSKNTTKHNMINFYNKNRNELFNYLIIFGFSLFIQFHDSYYLPMADIRQK